MYIQTEYTLVITPNYQYWFSAILGWFSKKNNSEWGLDPPTHFHSKLGFLEKHFFAKPLSTSFVIFSQSYHSAHFISAFSPCYRPFMNLLLLLLHLFTLLCGVNVSCETPPPRQVLRVVSWQFSLRQVVHDAIQPPPLLSPSPSFPRHLHPHHSLAYVFVFSFQNMPIPRHPTLLHFLGYFSHFRRPSNSFIPNSVQLGDSTHPS